MNYFSVIYSSVILSEAKSLVALLLIASVFFATAASAQDRFEVTISGQVNIPGKYAVNKGERLSSLISKAGGYTETAYLRGAWLTRESVRTDQQKALDDMTRRLEEELFWQTATQSAVAVKTTGIEREQKTKLIEIMRKLQAKGRVKISLAHIRLLKGSENDLELENGDTLVIPERSGTVKVAGSVKNSGSFTHAENCPFKDYINAAGGCSEYADTENAFVMKVDGSAIKLSGPAVKWNEEKARWELTWFTEDEVKIEPGDIILVPERIAWLKQVQDLPRILMTTAELTGTTIYLF